MTTTITITLNLTQEQLELQLVATTRLLTYYYAEKHRGNSYAAASIPDLVEINHLIVRRLQILKHQAVFNDPQLVPLDAQPAAQETEIG